MLLPPLLNIALLEFSDRVKGEAEYRKKEEKPETLQANTKTMLPGSGVRRRVAGVSVAEGMQKLSSVVNDSARRYRRLPFFGKVIFCLSLLFSFFLYVLIFRYFVKHDIADDGFLEVDKCPACLGSSACGLMYHNQVQFSGWGNHRLGDIFSFKNVRYGTLYGSQSIVLKKMASETGLQEMDKKICADANRPEGCDVARVMFLTNTYARLKKEGALQPKHLKQSAGMFTCASYRLMDRMWSYYKELRKHKSIMAGDQLQVWYTASLNPEPLMLQTFPASERWPFPEYFGACGRQALVEHVGRTLEDFYHEPFHKRAGVAFELLKIAEQLTNNEEDFALYITDPHWENFGVDASGKVRILDAENIIVVDKLAIEARKPLNYDKFFQSDSSHCEDSTCLAMRPDELCSRLHSDHNYYAICHSLLDPRMTDSTMPGGLLHHMPEEAIDFWDLEHLLKECAEPSKYKGRIFAKDKLLTALARLHDQSDEHNAPPPKPDKRGLPPPVKRKKELWEYEDYDDGVVNDAKATGDNENEKDKDNAKDIGFEEEKGKGAVVLE